MVKICTDTEFVRPFMVNNRYSYTHPKARRSMGYYMDGYLKDNIDRYMIPAVKSRFDYVTLITGLEGCQPAGSKVLMADGTWKNIEDVVIGDRVISPSKGEGTSKVLSVMTYFSKKNYAISEIDSKKILYMCSSNHLIPLWHFDSVWKDTFQGTNSKPTHITAESLCKQSTQFKKLHFSCACSWEDTSILRYFSITASEVPGSIVYGFTLDSLSGWYITDWWCVTHNTGKDTLASSIARYIDPTFNAVERECFTVDQLMEQIDKVPPESALIFSEAVMGMLAQDASTAIQVRVIKKFVTMRSKRLYVFLLLPSIFLLRRYFAVLRTKLLLHVYSPDSVHRGYFKFYGMDTKRKLYLAGAKMMDMSAQRPDFQGRFTDTWGCFFDANAYEEKKQATVAMLSQSDSTRDKVSVSTERAKNERNVALLMAYKMSQLWYDLENPGLAMRKPMNDARFAKLVMDKLQWKISPTKVRGARETAQGYLEEYWRQKAVGTKIDEAFGDLSSLPDVEKERIKSELKEEEIKD